MPFVLIGFIILLVSFIIALASLIREQGQRADFEAFDEDLSISAEEASQTPASEYSKDEEAADLVLMQTGGMLKNEPNLAEYAPFPWEDTSIDIDSGKANEGISGFKDFGSELPAFSENRDNLTGEISLSELKKNFR